MVSYRFCRPDDMPFVVRAVNECFNVHFPGIPTLTLDALRAEVKEVDVWPSNCMVAIQGADPVAVCVGTKRPDEVLISRVGVHPEYQRLGHGRHILTSLSQKLAVLGPERLIAELPADRPEVLAFFEASGYRRETPLRDWIRTGGDSREVPEELVPAVSAAELMEQGALDDTDGDCWTRSRKTLVNRAELLAGLAIASPEQVEACLLHRPAEPPEELEEVVALWCRQPERRESFYGLLLQALAGRCGRPLRLARAGPDEFAPELLRALQFEPDAVHYRYAAKATPA